MNHFKLNKEELEKWVEEMDGADVIVCTAVQEQGEQQNCIPIIFSRPGLYKEGSLLNDQVSFAIHMQIYSYLTRVSEETDIPFSELLEDFKKNVFSLQEFEIDVG